MKRLALIAVLQLFSAISTYSLIQIDSLKYFNDGFFLNVTLKTQEDVDNILANLNKMTPEEKSKSYLNISNISNDWSTESALKYAYLALNTAEANNLLYEKYLAYRQLTYDYAFIGRYDSAHKYCDLYIDETSTSKDSLVIAQGYVMKGYICYFSYEEYRKAFEYLFKAIDIYESLGDQYGLAICYNYLGRSYYFINSRDKAITYFHKSLDISLSLSEYHLASGCYLWINNTYIRLGDSLNNSEQYFTLAEKYLKKAGWIYNFLYYYREIGSYYMDKNNNYDSALVYFFKAIDFAKEHRLYYHLGNYYSLISHVYYKQQNDSLEIKYNLLALEARKKHGITYLISSSCLNIGNYYLRKNNFREAKKYIDEGFNIANELKFKLFLRYAYHLLYQYYKKTGNNKKSLFFHEKYTQINDSLTTDSKNRRIIELEHEYILKNKEKEKILLENRNRINELEISQQTTLRNFLVLTLFLLFISLSLIIARYRNKRKTNDILETANEKLIESNTKLEETNNRLKDSEKALKELNDAKDKFFSIAAHDMKNPLYYFKVAFEMLSESFDQYNVADKKNMLNEMKSSSDNLYSFLENLLLWSNIQTGSVMPNAEEFDLVQMLENTLSNKEKLRVKKNISFVCDFVAKPKVFADPAHIILVLKNILSNAIKYSFEGSDINITLEANNDFIELSVEDFGVGMNDIEYENLYKIEYKHNKPGTMKEKGTGLGLIVSKALIELNNGSIWIERKETAGIIVRILLPAENQ